MNIRKLLSGEFVTPCGHIVGVGVPAAPAIELADIVYAMARTNRFGGWWKNPVTVLNHTFLVYELSKKLVTEAFLSRREEQNAGQLLACYALLHDAHEAYLGDQTRPVETLDKFRVRSELKAKYDDVIFKLAGLPSVPPRWIQEIIDHCDEWAAEIEADRFLIHGRAGWVNAARGTGPVPNNWLSRQESLRPYEGWHFFETWMKAAPLEGRRWAINGLLRMKEVCPDLYLVDDSWLQGEMDRQTDKSGGF